MFQKGPIATADVKKCALLRQMLCDPDEPELGWLEASLIPVVVIVRKLLEWHRVKKDLREDSPQFADDSGRLAFGGTHCDG